MYGEPLKPNRTGFEIAIDPYDEDKTITLSVIDLDEQNNDDVREIDHPDFDILWGNSCENMFEPNTQDYLDSDFGKKYTPNPKELKALTTIEEARQWCLSIGMVEQPGLSGTVGG